MKPRLLLLALLTLLWAGLYLPALGETELKGEEPRRILPGLHMIASGDWLHTYIGATPYVRKPPLVNWAIAGSVLATGQYSEFAYRLPSVLAVLALVLGTAVFTWRWLGPNGAFLAGVFILTNISMLEKGRLAEIEAIYIACSGLAIAWWLPRFATGVSAWAQWAVPGVFLGLGMLAKGPAHLLYFYAVVLGACWATKNWRSLLAPAHLITILLTAGIFAAWAVPYAQSGSGPASDPETAQVGAAWIGQLTSRLGFDDFKLGDWLLNVPRGVMNLLPWSLFFPLLWNQRWLAALADDRERAVIRGARNGVVIAFVLVSIMPGALERYTLPLLVPIFLLLARVMVAQTLPELRIRRKLLGNPAVDWLSHKVAAYRFWFVGIMFSAVLMWILQFGFLLKFANSGTGNIIWIVAGILIVGMAGNLTPNNLKYRLKFTRLPGYHVLAAASALLLVGGILFIATFAPILRSSDNLRPIRAKIMQHVPAGSTLWVQDSGWRPFWAYLAPEARYYTKFKEAPFGPEPLVLLVKENAAQKAATDSRFATRPGRVVHTLEDKEGNKLALVQFSSEPQAPEE